MKKQLSEHVSKIAKDITEAFYDYREENDVHPRMFDYLKIYDEYFQDYIDSLRESGMILSEEDIKFIDTEVDIEC